MSIPTTEHTIIIIPVIIVGAGDREADPAPGHPKTTPSTPARRPGAVYKLTWLMRARMLPPPSLLRPGSAAPAELIVVWGFPCDAVGPA